MNNEQLMLNKFIMNFTNLNHSIISYIFNGTTHSITINSKCQKLKYDFHPFFFQEFPLDQESKYQLILYNNQIIN